MSSVETGQMSAAETGQMSAAETIQMSAVETGQKTLQEQTSLLCQQTMLMSPKSQLPQYRNVPV